jgi:hypothetical protein
MSGFTIERLAQALLDNVKLVDAKANEHEIESLAASVALQTVLPKDINGLSVDKILEFREKYPSERGAFQKSVREFLKPREWLNKIKDQKTLLERLQSEYEKSFKPKLEDLHEKLNDLQISTVTGCLNAKMILPPLAPKAAAAMGIGIDPITAAALGFAWVTIPIWRDKRKAMREALRAADVAYLYRVEADLKPQTLATWIKSATTKFFFRV